MDSHESLLWSSSTLYRDDSISHIFRLEEEGIEETEFPVELNEEDESGGEEELDQYGIIEKT